VACISCDIYEGKYGDNMSETTAEMNDNKELLTVKNIAKLVRRYEVCC
jgi:hypothetical protein